MRFLHFSQSMTLVNIQIICVSHPNNLSMIIMIYYFFINPKLALITVHLKCKHVLGKILLDVTIWAKLNISRTRLDTNF